MTDLVSQLVGALEASRAYIARYGYTGEQLAIIDAALTAAKAGGWVAVPVEPTPQMTWAATVTADREWCYHVGRDDAKKLWAAILALRPAQQATPEPVGEAWGWVIVDKHDTAQAIRPRRQEFFGVVQESGPFTAEEVAKMDREWAGLVPHRMFTLYTRPEPGVPDGVQWFTVAEHGMPDFDEEVIGGLWYTDPWLKPDRAVSFLWGVCRVVKDDHRDFKGGKRWHTFGPSHSDITHWARLNMPALAAAQAKGGGHV